MSTGMIRRDPLWDLLQAAIVCVEDGCPARAEMQLCRHGCECEGLDDPCSRCWIAYLTSLANPGWDPYAYDRKHSEEV